MTAVSSSYDFSGINNDFWSSYICTISRCIMSKTDPLFIFCTSRTNLSFWYTPSALSWLMIVYNTSVLATIPPSVSDLLVNEPNRLRTLFSVGVSDIPMLERLSSSQTDPLINSSDVQEQGWVACTTD